MILVMFRSRANRITSSADIGAIERGGFGPQLFGQMQGLRQAVRDPVRPCGRAGGVSTWTANQVARILLAMRRVARTKREAQGLGPTQTSSRSAVAQVARDGVPRR